MHNILMADPQVFAIQYEINPWMDKNDQPDSGLVQEQWGKLKKAIKNNGGQVCVAMTSKDNIPDFVFAANAGVVHNKDVFVSRFNHEERQNEEEEWISFFKSYNADSSPYFNVHYRDDVDFQFEGAGDWLKVRDNVFVTGHGFRSNIESNNIVAETLNVEQIPLKLVNPYFYHLDTCFCPLDVKIEGKPLVMLHPGAFDTSEIKPLYDDFLVIEVNDEDAKKFACNSVVINEAVIVPAGCEKLNFTLSNFGFNVVEVEMDQFLKSGGAAKCLTLRLS